jgi:hypothetical protein
MLNRVLRLSGAKVVLSSSWRHAFRDVQDSQTFFASVGFTGTIIAHTPSLGERGHEILTWLDAHGEAHGVTLWVAVDDGLVAVPAEAFVRTNIQVGLTPRDARRMLEVLLKD